MSHVPYALISLTLILVAVITYGIFRSIKDSYERKINDVVSDLSKNKEPVFLSEPTEYIVIGAHPEYLLKELRQTDPDASLVGNLEETSRPSHFNRVRTRLSREALLRHHTVNKVFPGSIPVVKFDNPVDAAVTVLQGGKANGIQ